MKLSIPITVAVLLLSSAASFVRALDYGLWVKPELAGWTEAKDGGVAGTIGRDLFTDSFKINGLPFPADFRPHVSRKGWLQWTPCTGQDRSSYGNAFEAIQFRFPSGIPEGKRLYARVYLRGKGWQKTLLVQQMSVLGTTELGLPLEAIQLSYMEGETGTDEELVRKADERFNRLLPAGGEPPSVVSPAYASIEPGLGRWSWDNTSKEFLIEPGGIAKGYKDDRPGKWVTVKSDTTGRTYQLDWKNGNGSTSTDILTVSWDGSRMTGESITHYKLIASRVDGLSQLRPLEDVGAKKRIAELDWKLESLMLPKVSLEQGEFGAAVDYFRLQCLRENRDEEDPTRRGFNVVVAPPAGFMPPKISLAMENVHAGKVLEEIARQSGLVVQTEPFALVLKSKDEPHRVPTVPPGLVKPAEELMIPVVALEGTSLAQAIEFLKRRSAELSGDGKAFDISIVEGANPAAVVTELQLRNVPLSEALRCLAAVTAQPMIVTEGMFIFGFPRSLPLPARETAPDSKPAPVAEVDGTAPDHLDPAWGTWAWRGRNPFILEADGSITQPPRRGRWKRHNPGKLPARYEFTWEGEPYVDSVTMDAEGKSMTGINQFKTALTATRMGLTAPDCKPEHLFTDGEGYRTWIDAKTGRSIEARVLTKKTDSSEVHVARKDGKAVWLVASNLSEADQFFINHWVAPEEIVVRNLVEFGNPGWKKYRVKVSAGVESLLVKVTGDAPGNHDKIKGVQRPPFTRIIPSGEVVWIEFACGNDHRLEVTANGKPVGR